MPKDESQDESKETKGAADRRVSETPSLTPGPAGRGRADTQSVTRVRDDRDSFNEVEFGQELEEKKREIRLLTDQEKQTAEYRELERAGLDRDPANGSRLAPLIGITGVFSALYALNEAVTDEGVGILTQANFESLIEVFTILKEAGKKDDIIDFARSLSELRQANILDQANFRYILKQFKLASDLNQTTYLCTLANSIISLSLRGFLKDNKDNLIQLMQVYDHVLTKPREGLEPERMKCIVNDLIGISSAIACLFSDAETTHQKYLTYLLGHRNIQSYETLAYEVLALKQKGVELLTDRNLAMISAHANNPDFHGFVSRTNIVERKAVPPANIPVSSSSLAPSSSRSGRDSSRSRLFNPTPQESPAHSQSSQSPQNQMPKSRLKKMLSFGKKHHHE